MLPGPESMSADEDVEQVIIMLVINQVWMFKVSHRPSSHLRTRTLTPSNIMPSSAMAFDVSSTAATQQLSQIKIRDP